MVVRLAALCSLLLSWSVFAPLSGAQSSDSSNSALEALYNEARSAEASGDYAAAAADYQKMLKADPHLGVPYNNLGALYFKQGRYREAAEVLEHGLKVDPKMSSANALLGMSLFKMGDFAAAKPHLEAVVAANPSDNNAELFLVNDLTKLGDFHLAAAHLQKLAKRQPDNQQIWYLLGKVYIQLSEEALGKVNQIDPNSVWAHEVSAELDESMKNYDGAVVEWKKAVESAPQQAGVHYKLGDLYWSLSQWENATEQFNQELAVDPNNCMVQWKLGDILLRTNADTNEALGKIDKALAACPNLTEARGDRARLLLKLHREADAIAELQAVEKSDPSEPSTHFLLAQAYRATGKTEEAQAEMKSFSMLEEKSRAATAERAQEVIKNSQSAH